MPTNVITPAANSASGTRSARQAEHAPREHDADRRQQRHRRPHRVADERHERAGHVLEPAHAPEVVGELGGRVERVQRVAGDGPVGERPDAAGAATTRERVAQTARGRDQTTSRPASTHASGRSRPGEHEQRPRRAARRRAHARPHHEREERRVDVAARGVEQERRARGHEQRRQRARSSARRPRRRAGRCRARAPRARAGRRARARGPRSRRRPAPSTRAERDVERVLGRRGVGRRTSARGRRAAGGPRPGGSRSRSWDRCA